MTFTDGITYNVVSDSSDQDEEKLTTIMGETATTVEQMMRYYESSGNQYPSEALGKGGAPTLRDFCQMYSERNMISSNTIKRLDLTRQMPAPRILLIF